MTIVSRAGAEPVIVIVGGGCSGALVFINMLRELASHALTSRLIMFERTKQVARGVAYSTQSPAHILNVPADAMGAGSDNPRSFHEWLVARGEPYQAGDFAPRSLYGDYLTELLEAERAKHAHLCAEIVRDDVVGVSRGSPARWLVKRLSGVDIEADFVVFATGNDRPSIPTPLRSIVSSSRFIANPWAPTPEGVARSERVLIVGTSLTAIDTILDLERREAHCEYTLLSRHGLLPLSHERGRMATPCTESLSTFATVRSAMRWLRAAAKQRPWIEVVDSLRPHLPTIWRSWSPAEQGRFVRHPRAQWLAHRHRAPAESLGVLRTLADQGRLRVIAGSLTHAEADEDGCHVEYRPRGSRRSENLSVDYVLNCSGPAEEPTDA
ncbi:MAG: FAD/NAD(P)-binding protein, partial [Deltaproteobacteria bacterium]|nr:FAD/NAD(P)-binding protein [Deltaproteobacteria bacterium]